MGALPFGFGRHEVSGHSLSLGSDRKDGRVRSAWPKQTVAGSPVGQSLWEQIAGLDRAVPPAIWQLYLRGSGQYVNWPCHYLGSQKPGFFKKPGFLMFAQTRPYMAVWRVTSTLASP
ncbi:MAG: hypothetical protein KME26_27240 [Oscillatoria princeps RMCB-10]|nr:hypothetical protein [Oscillatoria princeps RMCB-10]